jgi:hypothetical protein
VDDFRFANNPAFRPRPLGARRSRAGAAKGDPRSPFDPRKAPLWACSARPPRERLQNQPIFAQISAFLPHRALPRLRFPAQNLRLWVPHLLSGPTPELSPLFIRVPKGRFPGLPRRLPPPPLRRDAEDIPGQSNALPGGGSPVHPETMPSRAAQPGLPQTIRPARRRRGR